MNNDLISREALKEAIETYDKFACLPDGKLEPFRNLEHPEMFEPYVHLRDILNGIDKAPTVEYPFYQEAYQTGFEEGKNERNRLTIKAYRSGYENCKKDVIHSIAKQYSEHNELVPSWLHIGNMRETDNEL